MNSFGSLMQGPNIPKREVSGIVRIEYPDGDVEAFVDCLVRLHEDRDYAVAMTERADRFTIEHSWDREFDRYLTLLENATGRSLRPAAKRG